MSFIVLKGGSDEFAAVRCFEIREYERIPSQGCRAILILCLAGDQFDAGSSQFAARLVNSLKRPLLFVRGVTARRHAVALECKKNLAECMKQRAKAHEYPSLKQKTFVARPSDPIPSSETTSFMALWPC
jgi:hypothetical protein